MFTFVTDSNVVGETEAVQFEMLQQGVVSALVQLVNIGSNTINYRFTKFNGTSWVDTDVIGTDEYNTLTAGQIRHIRLDESEAKVRLVANASGGSVLEFAASRYFNRTNGGQLPLLTF